VRAEAIDRLQTAAHEIVMRRGLDVTWRTRLDQAAVAMDSRLVDALTRAVARSGAPVLQMPSGAGHDAMILAAHMPAAMLFVRSPGGISHHPDESVLEPDVAAALAAGREFLNELAHGSVGPRRATSDV
jgi:allantoate deiminase